MIEAFYKWAFYIYKKDGYPLNSDQFNSALENIITSSNVKEKDLEEVYNPISHIFESEIDKIDKEYDFRIITSDGNSRPIRPSELKYIMFPKKGLTGKAQQSIGRSIFARILPKRAREESGATFNKEKKKVEIPENALIKFWRMRILDTYFQSFENTSQLLMNDSSEKVVCPFCRREHRFRNIRFNPPVNIYVENITNYNSYLTNEPSHSICAFCSMLFMRTVVPEKGPEKIPFPHSKNAFIYILPFDPENETVYELFSKEKAESFLKEELEKTTLTGLNYLLSLPVTVYKLLPRSYSSRIKPVLYIFFADRSKQAEDVSNYFIVTRFDYLSKVGEKINQYGGIRKIFNFEKRLDSFIQSYKEKTSGYKLVFRFLGKMLADGEINFNFLHRILRNEISLNKRKNKSIHLYGYEYLKAFLKAKMEV